ncbi:hypothetical protein BCR44DRAFT_38522, partial [Catenaria anguillulae PL171]
MFDFDEDDEKGPTPTPSTSDLWKYVCMNGGKATNSAGRTVTFLASIDSRSDIVDLLRAWKGSPLFLERLLHIRGHRNEKPLLKLPLDLDTACQAGAGVAVLDWMYSLRNVPGRCKWSSNGYHHLKDNKFSVSLKWWDEMELPKGPRPDVHTSDFESDSEHDYESHDDDFSGTEDDYEEDFFSDDYDYDYGSEDEGSEDEGAGSDDSDGND